MLLLARSQIIAAEECVLEAPLPNSSGLPCTTSGEVTSAPVLKPHKLTSYYLITVLWPYSRLITHKLAGC